MQLTVPRFGKILRKQYRKAFRLYRQYVDLYIRDRSLRWVERFVFSWVAVFILSAGVVLYQNYQIEAHYLTDGPREGGEFVEGVVGEVNAINPIFSGNRTSRIAETLLFQSLFTYDGNGEIVPELARDHAISENSAVYTVHLRENARWHDGEPITAEDVVFTFRTIQNPDTGSSLQPAWRDVDIKAVDKHTVQFTLPNPFAPFLDQLTTGIVPAHILRQTKPSQLRVAEYNQSPIGSGPFVFDEISGQRIHLEANTEFPGKTPKVEEFDIAMYTDTEAMITAYDRGEISAMVADGNLDIRSMDNRDRSNVQKVDLPSQVFAFINTERISNTKVRRALTRGINRPRVAESLPGEFVTADSPLLPGHLGYMSAQMPYDAGKAKTLLDKAGWTVEGEKARKRNGKSLSIDIVTQQVPHYINAANTVANQWKQLGIETDVQAVDSTNLQQDFIRPRNYDVLLFGVSVGRDPDVYAYWHSSQTGSTGRNLSQYQSVVVDSSLENGRTRFNKKLRAAKYETFQKTWRSDAPAVALYRLHDYYVWRTEARGIEIENIARTIDRFYNVEDWTIRTQPVLRRLYE